LRTLAVTAHDLLRTPAAKADVCIAGGGPCGLMLANELGRRAIRAVIADDKPGQGS
jgi:ribulose 1,5-bisphosphate synthetase/thiazole synthase